MVLRKGKSRKLFPRRRFAGRRQVGYDGNAMNEATTFDVAVVGAGVFGAWTAWHLTRRKLRVLLLDAYGPAHARASSGGETRIIRMSYGRDEIYTRWSQNSLQQWKGLFEKMARPLFHQTGVLWLSGKDETRLQESAKTLQKCGVNHQQMDRREMEARYPQINLAAVNRGLLEPD